LVNEFDEIVHLYKDRIFKMLYMKVGNMEDAMDLTQDVFLKVYRALPGFRGDSNIYTWIYRIAINTANTFLKKRGRFQSSSIENMEDNSLKFNLNNEENLKTLLKSKIEELPEHYKDVLLLHYFEGFDYKEIADVLGINIGTVKSRLFRARELLSQKMRRYL